MLGHELTFAYCRAPARDLPCGKVFDCWFETFDVRTFIGEHFTDQQIAQVLTPRVDKVSSLLGLIQQAQARTEGGE